MLARARVRALLHDRYGASSFAVRHGPGDEQCAGVQEGRDRERRKVYQEEGGHRRPGNEHPLPRAPVNGPIQREPQTPRLVGRGSSGSVRCPVHGTASLHYLRQGHRSVAADTVGREEQRQHGSGELVADGGEATERLHQIPNEASVVAGGGAVKEQHLRRHPNYGRAEREYRGGLRRDLDLALLPVNALDALEGAGASRHCRRIEDEQDADKRRTTQ
mmetsp:Transcript_41538/g.130071  ORF Transcript_41538/g.130071 Transcript_41538/m.130071 type:complete len:218 (-) Transcript_41538:335-988(-)